MTNTCKGENKRAYRKTRHRPSKVKGTKSNPNSDTSVCADISASVIDAKDEHARQTNGIIQDTSKARVHMGANVPKYSCVGQTMKGINTRKPCEYTWAQTC